MLQNGLTPLHLTAQEDMVNAAEVLAKHDANLDQQTKVQTDMHVHTKNKHWKWITHPEIKYGYYTRPILQ